MCLYSCSTSGLGYSLCSCAHIHHMSSTSDHQHRGRPHTHRHNLLPLHSCLHRSPHLQCNYEQYLAKVVNQWSQGGLWCHNALLTSNLATLVAFLTLPIPVSIGDTLSSFTKLTTPSSCRETTTTHAASASPSTWIGAFA